MTTYGLFGLLLLPLLLMLACMLLLPRRRKTVEVKLYPRPLLENDSSALFRRLRTALPQYVVLSRVSLAAFLEAKGGDSGSMAAARADLAQQVVDFLICTADFRIVAAVELDDVLRGRRSHEQSARLLRQAAIPLLRWNTVNLPTVRDIQEAVAELETLRLIQVAQEDGMDVQRMPAISGSRQEPRL